jgi:putative N6-adenine-specific DNA methylase
LELIATAAFGLEAVVERELEHLGYAETTVSDGRVTFQADAAAIARTNLWLRSADRVLAKIGEFEVRDFGELFDRTAALDWAAWLPRTARFPVRGKSTRSRLHSVPDCQSIVKKAIVEKLKQTYRASWFEESGSTFSVEVSIVRDRAILAIDTTGPGLHKRGYRRTPGPSPLKETLAAALVQLSYWNPSRALLDPFCGTGTIPIEAALLGRNRAPGLDRSFDAEGWPRVPRAVWDQARSEARDLVVRPGTLDIVGSDVDEASLALAAHNAAEAGISADVAFRRQSFADAAPRTEYGCLIANPPYGERSGQREDAVRLARESGAVLRRFGTWSIYILTALAEFERLCGRQADRRRKLYNGPIACTYYQFQGPRPPAGDPRQEA